ncbi:flagellar biosynthetic protein FliO [Cohnella yongneupensis]|uniref:Flagellar biosynthetic protein FliO n=1 Tax=Cohnella yongneupensis TaxID=425006 RepID=A0ABW0R6U9_9BACL
MRENRLSEGFQSAGSSWDLIWVLFVLGIIVGLIVLSLRFLAKRNRGWWMNRSLRSLGGLTLGTNKSMQIVEWNGRIYVLGIGDDVTLLDSITDTDTVASMLAEHDTSELAKGNPLPAWLRKFSGRNNAQGEQDHGPSANDSNSFEKSLESRLRQLTERRQRVEQLMEERRAEDRTDE